MPDHGAKAGEQDRAERQAQVLRQRQDDGVAEAGVLVGEEDGDHGWVDDVEAVVEHGDDEAGDEGRRQLAAVVAREDARGRQGLLQGRERLPQGEGDHGAEARHQGADDLGAGRRQRGGVDDAGEDEGRADGEEHGADVVELLEGLLGGQAAGVLGREVEKEETGEGEDDGDGWAVEDPAPLETCKNVL